MKDSDFEIERMDRFNSWSAQEGWTVRVRARARHNRKARWHSAFGSDKRSETAARNKAVLLAKTRAAPELPKKKG